MTDNHQIIHSTLKALVFIIQFTHWAVHQTIVDHKPQVLVKTCKTTNIIKGLHQPTVPEDHIIVEEQELLQDNHKLASIWHQVTKINLNRTVLTDKLVVQDLDKDPKELKTTTRLFPYHHHKVEIN